MAYIVGLDAHAKTSTFKVKDENGNLVATDTVPSTRASFIELARTYPSATVVVEASSVHEWIHDVLAAEGAEVFACHPVNIRRVLGKKNDEVDAGFLADAYRLGVLTRSYVPPHNIRALRQLCRRRAFITHETVRIKNRIHGILKRTGQRFQDDDDDSNVFALKNRKKLETVDPEIPSLLTFLDVFRTERRRLERELATIADENEDVRRLTTIPGFGPFTAVTIYAEIGDVTRFRNANALAAYFGLTPSEIQSGETLVRGHITKRGNSQVRWLLSQASWIHVTTTPRSALTKAYKRTSKRTGKKRAIIATARRLAKITYHILHDKTAFQLNG